MKIVSYNINGIRSGIKKGLFNWIEKSNPDILCLQEIKAFPEQIETNRIDDLGYYHYWFPSTKRKGYSGVGILCKKKPDHIEYGIGIDSIDQEGRILRLDFKKISVISLYIPSGKDMKNRLNFKFYFMDHFFDYVQKMKREFPNLIICGDYNICHKKIDIHDPVRNRDISGFLPRERKWMNDFLNLGFIDSFRNYVKEARHYSWWSYRYNAKKNNKGWRIDYAMVSHSLKKEMINAYLLSEISYSDHCPTVLEIK
ncbi:MAG: exodeoxyribonuclease III [Flavobacteriales bacterium]|jgi:exodeoxyribonuclease-3|uniref:exodeoxyribonuclease III n=1 Tax=Blattabacterium sp. (Mastotermes darwiniensis) TaxID=39768 RepID=UPI000231DFC0|nr:exodeoxyribonuclease III [Blattabacterium sp. (Mastotermes darwiniensis)]AER40472.1 exodeoxyribonuclease III [Blattabacterium sp. (Mastotermes darwiniensis) str. MADAR]MDR1805012.1 exodeoxyribonuclease III [Flavobacteriales bacterium]